MYRNAWLRVVRFWLIALGLVLVPSTSSLAQSTTPTANSPVSEDSSSLWNEDSQAEPFMPKPESVETSPLEEDKQLEQLEPGLFIPYVQAAMSHTEDLHAAAIDATWQTIVFEGFEGIWPPMGGKWVAVDYNSTLCGGPILKLWDDTNTKAFNGQWSAHPTDGPPYVNCTATYMQYGPFSLVGALDAKMSFRYFLDSEAQHDFFSWAYSCTGTGTWTRLDKSGITSLWLPVDHSLKPCLGKSSVYVRFWFESDSSTTDQGVWVDDVKIQRLNPLP